MSGSEQTVWRKSSRSHGNGECVEVAELDAAVGVRDSKSPDADHLSLTAHSFTELVIRIRNGELHPNA